MVNVTDPGERLRQRSTAQEREGIMATFIKAVEDEEDEEEEAMFSDGGSGPPSVEGRDWDMESAYSIDWESESAMLEDNSGGESLKSLSLVNKDMNGLAAGFVFSVSPLND